MKSIDQISLGLEASGIGILKGKRCFFLARFRKDNPSSLYIRSVLLWLITNPCFFKSRCIRGLPYRLFCCASSLICFLSSESSFSFGLYRLVERLTFKSLQPCRLLSPKQETTSVSVFFLALGVKSFFLKDPSAPGYRGLSQPPSV